MGYSTNRLVVSCCCLLKESFQPILRYQATGQAFSVGILHTFQVCTQDVGEHKTGSSSGRGGGSGDHSSSSPLRPPAIRVKAYLVLCPPCGDLLACDHTSIFQRHKNNNNKKKENICIEWKLSEEFFAKFAVRSPGVAWLFLILPMLLLFS